MTHNLFEAPSSTDSLTILLSAMSEFGKKIVKPKFIREIESEFTKKIVDL